MRIFRAILPLACVAALAGCGQAADDDARAAQNAVSADGLIARSALFGAPERFRGRLSPDGTKISWLASRDGVMNVWTAPVEAPEKARAVSGEPVDVRYYVWAHNDTHLVYLAPTISAWEGVVKSTDAWSGETRVLSPEGEGVSSWILGGSLEFPDYVVIGSNDRDATVMDLHKVNVTTGARERIFENVEGFTHFHLDNRMHLRLATRHREDGSKEVHRREDDGTWSLFDVVPAEDAAASRIIGFDGSNQAFYAADSRGLDAAALVHVDLATGARTFLGGVAGVDVWDVLIHPATFEAEAFFVDRLTPEWTPLTVRAERALQGLESLASETILILARTVDDSRWIIYADSDTSGGAYYVYEPESGALDHLFDVLPRLEPDLLSPTAAVVIPTRDGLELTAYLTLPPGADRNGDGVPERRSPLVVLPAAGGKERARLGFDPTAQWLADRGYAALAVNVRGVRGLGKSFFMAGRGAIADGVQRDFEDVVAWAGDRGVADLDRVAIVAEELSGSAALLAVARPDSPFACASTWNSPTDFDAFEADSPPYAAVHINAILRMMAGADADGATPLALAPPQRPLLMVMGADGRDAMLTAAEAYARAADPASAPTTLVEMPNFGWTSVNVGTPLTALRAAQEAFLAGCLGGALQPIADDLAAVPEARVRFGAEHVPGLAAVLGEGARLELTANDPADQR